MEHTCGGPVFGRLEAGCPRCDELKDGAAPKAGWFKPRKYDGVPPSGAPRHNCKVANCAIVCTFGDW
jgi:hypothetical protein